MHMIHVIASEDLEKRKEPGPEEINKASNIEGLLSDGSTSYKKTTKRNLFQANVTQGMKELFHFDDTFRLPRTRLQNRTDFFV